MNEGNQIIAKGIALRRLLDAVSSCFGQDVQKSELPACPEAVANGLHAGEQFDALHALGKLLASWREIQMVSQRGKASEPKDLMKRH